MAHFKINRSPRTVYAVVKILYLDDERPSKTKSRAVVVALLVKRLLPIL